MDSIRRLLVMPRMDSKMLARAPGKKTTSDDLRDVVFNFNELEAALEGRYHNPCVLKMLREVTPTVHPVCRCSRNVGCFARWRRGLCVSAGRARGIARPTRPGSVSRPRTSD